MFKNIANFFIKLIASDKTILKIKKVFDRLNKAYEVKEKARSIKDKFDKVINGDTKAGEKIENFKDVSDLKPIKDMILELEAQKQELIEIVQTIENGTISDAGDDITDFIEAGNEESPVDEFISCGKPMLFDVYMN
ncbi:MAG: hypothetical protein DGJ47_000159 [Rickettsiaceae bacterium]